MVNCRRREVMTLHPTFKGICEAHGAPEPEPFRVWQSGEWTILHVRAGGAETTSSLTAKEARNLSYRLRSSARQLPNYKGWNGVGKYSVAISFDSGCLTVNLNGYDGTADGDDGDAFLAFSDYDLEFERDEGRDYRWIKISNADLLHLRDKLNEIFSASADTHPQGGDVKQAPAPLSGAVAESETPKGTQPKASKGTTQC